MFALTTDIPHGIDDACHSRTAHKLKVSCGQGHSKSRVVLHKRSVVQTLQACDTAQPHILVLVFKRNGRYAVRAEGVEEIDCALGEALSDLLVFVLAGYDLHPTTT